MLRKRPFAMLNRATSYRSKRRERTWDFVTEAALKSDGLWGFFFIFAHFRLNFTAFFLGHSLSLSRHHSRHDNC
jgi:hypothetical protein